MEKGIKSIKELQEEYDKTGTQPISWWSVLMFDDRVLITSRYKSIGACHYTMLAKETFVNVMDGIPMAFLYNTNKGDIPRRFAYYAILDQLMIHQLVFTKVGVPYERLMYWFTKGFLTPEDIKTITNTNENGVPYEYTRRLHK